MKKQLKVKRWKDIYHANTNHKSARMAILITGKVDFRTETLPGKKKNVL